MTKIKMASAMHLTPAKTSQKITIRYKMVMDAQKLGQSSIAHRM